VATLLCVGFAAWILCSDGALAAIKVSASSAAPCGTLLASATPPGKQSSSDRRYTLLDYHLHHLDFETHDTLALGAQVPKSWPASPVNIAHRGGKYLAPENTLIGFQEGLTRAGVDVLEFDVHLTADGHLVVIHDDSVDRTTDGTGLVREMTLQEIKEIKQLDAGYEFTENGGKTYPYRDLGITVPTLEEVYQAFPNVPVNIEIKEDQPGIEKALWQEIKEAAAEEDRTLVVSGRMNVISRFREVSAGQVATGASIREMVAFLLWSSV
jgi:glycerophosphoryl diester phosphodiesterase